MSSPVPTPTASRKAESGSRRSRSTRHEKSWSHAATRPRGLTRLSSGLLKPWRIMNNWIHHWGVGDWILGSAYRLRRLMQSMLKFDGSSQKSLGADGQEVFCQWPSAKTMANPLWWFVWSGQFAVQWICSRPFLVLASAVPGVAFLLAFFAVATAGSRLPSGGPSGTYRRLMVEAAEAENFDTARLLGDAALSRNPRSVDLVFDRAVVEERAGDLEQARRVMAYGARELESPTAALWLAERVGDRNKISSWPAARQDEYAEWLDIALRLEPENNLARKALADLLRVQNRFREAYDTLLPLAQTDSDANYILVILEKELGMQEQALQRAKQMLKTHLLLLEDVPQHLEARIQSASLFVFLAEPDNALNLLTDGLRFAKDPASMARLRRSVADAHVLVSQRLAQTNTSPSGVMARFEHLRLAVDFDASSRAVIDAVTQACVDAEASDNQELAILKEAIVRGVSPDASHFILGTLALNENDFATAMHHLEIAVQSNPQLPGLLNNLAYAMCQQDGADLEKALAMSNAAARTSAGNAYVRETRGQILIKLERWSEAVADLEFALTESTLRALVRPSLAIAYDNLGQDELADRHRLLARQGR